MFPLKKSRFSTSIGLTLAILLGGCASTQTGQTTSGEAPAAEAETVSQPARLASADEGGDATRLVIYRTSYLGLAVQPKIFVNGDEAAVCAPGRATTVSVPPGTLRISARTVSENTVTVNAVEGQTTYVRCALTPGLVVGGVQLKVIPPDQARPKVTGLTQK